jgi:hypothetical protein
MNRRKFLGVSSAAAATTAFPLSTASAARSRATTSTPAPLSQAVLAMFSISLSQLYEKSRNTGVDGLSCQAFATASEVAFGNMEETNWNAYLKSQLARYAPQELNVSPGAVAAMIAQQLAKYGSPILASVFLPGLESMTPEKIESAILWVSANGIEALEAGVVQGLTASAAKIGSAPTSYRRGHSRARFQPIYDCHTATQFSSVLDGLAFASASVGAAPLALAFGGAGLGLDLLSDAYDC